MRKEKHPVDEARNKELEGISAGLIGIGVIAIIELVALAQLDWSLTIMLYGFTVSIPMLSITVTVLREESRHKYAANDLYIVGPWAVGIFSSLAGIGALRPLLCLCSPLVCLPMYSWRHNLWQPPYRPT